MSISNLLKATNQAEQFLQQKSAFSFSRTQLGQIGVREEAVAPNLEAQIRSAEVFVDAANQRLQQVDLRQISTVKAEEIRKVVDFANRTIKNLAERATVSLEAIERLKAKALTARLGGCIDHQIFTDPRYETFRQFIENSSLHHQIQALRLQLPRYNPQGVIAAMLPIQQKHGRTIMVDWAHLNKQQILKDEKPVGYRFLFQEREVFRTDLSYRLDEDFTLLHQGIRAYNAVKDPEVAAFDHQNPEEWGSKYVLDIVTMMKDKKGETPAKLTGDHAFFVLKDDQGNCYSDGKFGPTMSSWGLNDYLTAFARKTGKTRTPDWYSLYPKDSHFFKTFSIELTKEQFEKVMQRFQKEKATGGSEFSLLKMNCTSFVLSVLKEELGIEMEAPMRAPTWMFRHIFPRSVQKFLFKLWDNTIGQLPDWAQKITYFFPLYYIPSLLIGLLILSLSLFNEKQYSGADLSFWDLLFKPWKFYCDHALPLKENLEAISVEGKFKIERDADGKAKLVPDLDSKDHSAEQ